MNTPDPNALGNQEQGRFHLGTWLTLHLGFGSIRGRYLWVTGFFVCFVLAAGWAAQQVVDQTARQSSTNVSEREEISRLLNDLSDDIWLTETALQGFLLSPYKQQRETTFASIDHLIADAKNLSITDWAQRSSSRQDKLRRLLANIHELRLQSARLIDIRTDAEKMFPAMRHMLDKMLPHNIEFLSLAALALAEAEEFRSSPVQIEIRESFSEARYAWAVMIGNFRVFVANRFGIFPGDPEAGMKNQHQQIEFYHELVDRHLGALARFDTQNALEFQQVESLSNMRKISRDWYQAYLAAAAIYSSERWRADVPLLHDSIRPLFSSLWVGMNVLRGELESASVTDMTSNAGVADRLSRALWVISFITIALSAAGYLFFEYTVRRPIANVARALKTEALVMKAPEMKRTTTAETNELIEAFEHMHGQVRSRQERLQTILDNAAEGIITFNAHGYIEGYNQAASDLFGWAEHDIIGQNITVLIKRESRIEENSFLEHLLNDELEVLIGQVGEVSGKRKGGSTFAMTIKISGMWLESKRLYVALVADNSERKAMIEHLRAKTEHDDLTGIHNRSYFLGELARVVERAHRQDRADHVSTLLYIDLDNFKYVNDTLGHLAGDRLLIEVSELLRKRARRSDLIARLGGDEFCMLLYDTRTEEAQSIAESFRRALTVYRFRQASEQVDVGCSIGVAMINAEVRSAEEVLSRADYACLLAKRDGRNRVHIFDVKDEMDSAALSLDMGWSRRIKDAIQHNRFALAKQPIVDTRTLQTSTYEVLLRMRDENGALIMPKGFLPAAERFGLCTDIDRWVIVNAIRMLAEQRRAIPDLRYSINLSGQTLSDPTVCDLVIHALQRFGLEPSTLTFEITETVAIANINLAETFLSKLRVIGCSTALDDFGTGMSSFGYLRELPVDYVKIDGRFVHNLAASATDQAMVRAMNDIAHALGKKTVAEFVEDESCFQLLREYGVDFVQGDHLGRPEVISEADNSHSGTDAAKRIVYLKTR